MTPEYLSGVWQRTSVSIDGGGPAESAVVLWFQLGDEFIDARFPRQPGPLSGPVAFAGRTTWHEPTLVWEHALDSSDPTSPGLGAESVDSTHRDQGHLSWDDGRLIEAGWLVHDGRRLRYIEVWERVEVPVGAACSHRIFANGFGCVSQIGSRRLAMLVDPPSRRWAAVHQQVVDGTWRSADEFGDENIRCALVRFVDLDLGSRHDAGASPPAIPEPALSTPFEANERHCP